MRRSSWRESDLFTSKHQDLLLIDDCLDCSDGELVAGIGSEGNPDWFTAQRFESVAVAGVARFSHGDLVSNVETERNANTNPADAPAVTRT